MKKQSLLNLTKTTDIESLLGEIGIVVVNHAGREIACQCPFHSDSHPSFSINAENGLWICYQCGESGSLERLLEKVAGVSEPKQLKAALKHVQRATFRPAARKDAADAITKGEALYTEPQDPYYLYAKYSAFHDVPGWALAERYITPESASHFGIRWNKGWVIPIWAPRKTQDIIVDFWGWQFKRMDHVDNYPPGIKKSRTLFGMNVLESRTAVLVESPLDVVRMHSVGIPAIASYGAMVSAYQISLIEAQLDRVILALDNDIAGHDQSAKLYPRFYRQLPTNMAVYPDGVKDPGDMTDKQLVEAFGERILV